MQMNVTVTLLVEGDWEDDEKAEEDLRNLDDAELWAIAKSITYEYDIVE